MRKIASSEKEQMLEKFREFVLEWKFESGNEDHLYELCWSYDNRDEVDPDRLSDDILWQLGNKVSFSPFGEAQYVLSLDGWLYVISGEVEDRKRGYNPTCLLFRVKWEDIEIVDVDKLKIVRGGGAE